MIQRTVQFTLPSRWSVQSIWHYRDQRVSLRYLRNRLSQRLCLLSAYGRLATPRSELRDYPKRARLEHSLSYRPCSRHPSRLLTRQHSGLNELICTQQGHSPYIRSCAAVLSALSSIENHQTQSDGAAIFLSQTLAVCARQSSLGRLWNNARQDSFLGLDEYPVQASSTASGVLFLTSPSISDGLCLLPVVATQGQSLSAATHDRRSRRWDASHGTHTVWTSEKTRPGPSCH